MALIFVMVAGCFVNAPGGYGVPGGNYTGNVVAQGFVDYLENTQPQLLEEIESTGALSAAVAESIRAELDAYKGQVSAQWQA